MTHEYVVGTWLDEESAIPLSEFVELSGMSHAEIRALVDCGVLTPVDSSAEPWHFHGLNLSSVRTLHRLHSTFDLEPDAMAVVLSLLERIRGLEKELRNVRACLADSVSGTG